MIFLTRGDRIFILEQASGEFQDENSTPECKKYHSLEHVLRMPAPVLFLSSEFSNFKIYYTLWDKTKGNIKRNCPFGRYFLLETNL